MKFKKSLLAVSAIAAISLSSHSFANETKTVSNAWTECGIGAVIFKDLPVGAAISNILWDWGTTAVISMAASPETCKGVKVAAATYINESADAIEADIATGNGKHLTAMLTLMGVEGENQATVTKTIRDSFAANPEVLSLTGTQKAQAIYLIAEKAATLS